MGWTEKITDGLRGLANSGVGKDLLDSAKAKAEAGLDEFLRGKPAEGERLVEEAKQEAIEAGEEARKEEVESAEPDESDDAPPPGTGGMH